MIAISRKDREKYVPEGERGKGSPASFLLGPPTMQQIVGIEELIYREGGDVRPLGQLGYQLLRAGLKGWEGVTIEGGASAPFELDGDGCPTDDTLAALPAILRAEVALQIFKRLNMTEDDRKNSSLPPESPVAK
jgi:hypothetical protein